MDGWLTHLKGDVGSKMDSLMHIGSTFGTCWRQDGKEEGQDNQMLPRVVGKRLAQSRLPTRHSPSEKFL